MSKELSNAAYANMMKEQALFMHVYRVPQKLNDGYCFGGGKPITFINVDWFGCPEEMKRDEIEQYIRSKTYCVAGYKYLVVSDTPDRTFMFTA